MTRLQSMVGYKLFKESEDSDSIEVLRILKVRKGAQDPDTITVMDEATKEKKIIPTEYIKGFTPLEPDGYFTIAIVTISNEDHTATSKDVIVTASKILDIKIMHDTFPYAICRQCITDVFNNLLISDTKDMMYGMSINKDDCPAGYDIGLMLACNSIDHSDVFNFYRTDTLDDILSMINLRKYDQVLNTLYMRHCKSKGDPKLQFKKEDEGWCKDVKTLLHQNTFQTDINEMLGITDLDFDLSKHFVQKPLPGKEGQYYDVLSDDCKDWLSSIFKVYMDEAAVIRFDNDINLADFNNNEYELLRDSTNTLYLVTYTLAGQYKESDLEEKAKHKDFSSEFKIKFYNKYNRGNNN